MNTNASPGHTQQKLCQEAFLIPTPILSDSREYWEYQRILGMLGIPENTRNTDNPELSRVEKYQMLEQVQNLICS